MTKQTEAQRLADRLKAWPDAEELDDAAALLRRQDELLEQAFRALEYIVGASAPLSGQQEQCWPSMRAALKELYAHREAK